MSSQNLRNIAIVAHVDHGKTTLVDELLKQSGTLDSRRPDAERVMDSNAIERERGITILAKNTSLVWGEHRINVVDTPGHADFGGEVERILSMVDAVLLLVDAVDGPMPQTRFVTQKAFAQGLNAMVAINKCDREGARPHWVLDQTFELFDRLGATDSQLDFPVIYCSATQGWARREPHGPEQDMKVLYETIIQHVSPPRIDGAERIGPVGKASRVAERGEQAGVVGEPGARRIRLGQVEDRHAVAAQLRQRAGQPVRLEAGGHPRREPHGTISTDSMTSPSRMRSTMSMPLSTWAKTV